jgi:uncharacterized protein YcbX
MIARRTVLNQEGRQRLATAVAAYVLTLDENPLADHPERLPLRGIGDGLTPRYHDAETGQVTLHGRGSLQALTAALANTAVSERRFRSNIALEGLGTWEEQNWVGRKVRIGTVEFDVVRPEVRCLATHANLTTGERDVPMLTTLTQVFGQEKPTFGVAMVPSQAGGHIHVGDPVMLVD